ncbi:MAG: hypothetical protein D6B26_02465 [Spirochaetaceae bacterium]|nr:MAG: hypothetical protein D6B26_02465 [Spirochaetaceae bacterium]
MNTKMKFLFIFFFLCGSFSIYASQPFYISLELAGSGGLASINAEKTIIQQGNIDLGLRAGFSIAPIDRNNGTTLVFPLMIQTSWGSPVHKAEFGFGQSISITTRGNFHVLLPLSLGYRLSPAGSRFFFRFSYTPLISWLLDQQWQHWAGLSIGYRMGD